MGSPRPGRAAHTAHTVRGQHAADPRLHATSNAPATAGPEVWGPAPCPMETCSLKNSSLETVFHWKKLIIWEIVLPSAVHLEERLTVGQSVS